MLGAEFMDEIDCGSFFDQMDDLIDFPADTDCPGLGSGNPDDFPSIWTDPAGGFPASDPIFSAGNSSNAASDLSAELSVPYEDIVQLEWLSNFVEDSFSGGGMTMNKENFPIKASAMNKENFPIKAAAVAAQSHQFQTSSPVSVLESSSTTNTTTTTSSSCNSTSWAGKKLPLMPAPRGPQKARSKRSRPRTFNPRLISPASSFMETPQAFPAPVASSDSENVVESEPLKKLDSSMEPKKKKKIKFTMPAEMNQNSVRKCLHCEITKTPQWRAGPMGPKTLCNACGVRYKSGRLFPEYRPAASPTFIPALHSNSHKKVIEMRTKGGDDNFLAETMKVDANEPELIPNSNPSLNYI